MSLNDNLLCQLEFLAIFVKYSVKLGEEFNDSVYCFNCRVSQLTEYSPQELIEKTLYQFIHPADVQHVRDSHLIRKFDRLH